ncbi:CRTAC1 family protein [Catenovulum adriaticum]|uniref:CRTAC1 family protein n=1 Tax=Catenovulum adriaticum TaxID=2984846 RepID=A0ABY7AMJ3_9ALTE|nr:CRTAC1 family protein [Catenovulum sp. TS8]WAJ70472.1 CRTAC1 family protein [Catenovulum sp. TS8]
MFAHLVKFRLRKLVLACAISTVAACSAPQNQVVNSVTTAPIKLDTRSVQTLNVEVEAHLTQRLTVTLENPANYANLTILSGSQILADSLNIPTSGRHTVNALVQFKNTGTTEISLLAENANLEIYSIELSPVKGVDLPTFSDISVAAGLDKVSSIKYGGPTIADFDNDGDYDFVVNNHNLESSKLYWNQGEGTVSKHHKDLSRWFMNDLHGTAAGDYDNDGDLDLVVTQGGGVGKNPSTANFYQNNNGELVLMTEDVGITKGGRGRGAKWSDMDLDGDLDLLLFNETSLHGDKPQHFFYENLGNAKFKLKSVPGIQDVHPSRAIVTDLNQDNIDDIIFYSPLSVWQGNGDFTFTDISGQFPVEVTKSKGTIAIADIDIDNDGDLDLYMTGGESYGQNPTNAPMFDFDALKQKLSIRSEGKPGIESFNFTAKGNVKFANYEFSARAIQRSKQYPIYVGKDKQLKAVDQTDTFILDPKNSTAWPTDTSKSGLYLGYLGNGEWKAMLVREKHLFWNYSFSLYGVNSATPDFEPVNRNQQDLLLRNDQGQFVDVSQEWKIPLGGKTNGVTVGDFNNDGLQDLQLYRWGKISDRISDLMLLNTKKAQFEVTSMHNASNINSAGHGDMGQAFDFDLDGRVDLLNGDESGEWYLYKNQTENQNTFINVRVGYSPKANIDPISARVTITTDKGIVYSRRVGSAGAIFSQSLLNIVHFGLADTKRIQSVKVRWRNGETLEFNNKTVNQMLDTDKRDPAQIAFESEQFEIRKTSTRNLKLNFMPNNADQSVRWQSANSKVLKVNQQGQITATGQVGDKTDIIVTSQANQTVARTTGTITKWQPVKVKSIDVSLDKSWLWVGEKLKINTSIKPEYADNKMLNWHTSTPDIIKISSEGELAALAPGQAVITVSAQGNNAIKKHIELEVKDKTPASINIINEDFYQNSTHHVGDTLVVKAEFHAGSGHKVILADQGGLRFWLRHFESEWIPVKDVILKDASVVGQESGEVEMAVSLKDLTPSDELPEGHFYLLGVSFASSNGQIYNKTIYPLKVAAPE